MSLSDYGPKAGFSTSRQRDKTTHVAAAIILHLPLATERLSVESTRSVRYSLTAMKPLKILAVACLATLILVAGAVAAIRLFFPVDQIRKQLEHTLSRQLQGTVRIAALEWDLLHGLGLGNVEIERDGARLARFDRLSLRYRLLPLLHGTLAVDEVALTRADIFVDLARFPVPSQAEPPPRRDEPVALPTLPLSLNVESIRLEHTHITVVGHDDLRVALRDVNLTSRLHAGPKTADLSGILEIADIEALLNQHQWRLPLHLAFALSVDLPAERLILERAEIRSDPLFNLIATGQVDHILSTQEVTFSVRESRLDLGALLSLAQPLLPPTLAGTRLAGTIEPLLAITGVQTDGGFDGTIRLDVKGGGIQGSVPSFGISLESSSFQLQTGEIPVRANRPGPIHADLSIKMTGITTEAAAVRDLTFGLQADRSEAGQLATHLTMKGVVSAALEPAGPSLTEPFTLNVDASGDETTLSFSLTKAEVVVGDLVGLVASSAVGPLGVSGGQAEKQRPFSLQATVRSDAINLVRLLPSSLRQGFELRSHGGPQTVSFTTTGTLAADWRPLRADVDLHLNAAGLGAVSAEQEIAGTLDRLTLAVRAMYRAKGESLRGTIDGAIRLKDLQQGTTVTVGTVTVTLNGKIDGRMGSDFTVRRLTAGNRLTSEFRDVRYTTPTVTGLVQSVLASIKAHGDLIEGPYVLDEARLIVGELLDGTASGTFTPRTQRLTLDIAVPSLNVAEIRRHLSGPAVESLASVKPSGQISMRISGSGPIPTPDDLAQLSIPIQASARITLQNVGGSFQDHGITGATGTISLSVEPPEQGSNKHQVVRTSWRLGADRLDVGGDAPATHLEQVALALEGSVESFDRLIVDRFTVGAEGLDATIHAELSGIKRLLNRKEGAPLLEGLGPLFAQSSLHVTVDLDRFANVVRSFGITGTGRAGLTVSLHKKERGPLDLRVTVQPQQLSLAHGEHRIEGLDGTIVLHKALRWLSSSDKPVREAEFRPTGLLPDLLLAAPAQRDIRIRLAKAGPIEVRNLSGHLFLDQNRLVVHNLAMNLLGGGLGGEVTVAGGKAFRVDLRMEAAGLDANRLLPVGDQVPGDSLIDATVTGTLAFDDQQGRLDFGKSTVELSLTRIGRHTLDRLLQFLDPTGSNPSIVGARSAISLANPSSARLTLSKGLVAIHIRFQQGLLSRFEMDRIPVSQIKQIRDLTATIPQWNDLRRLMALLGADRYGVDQTGEFVLE
ncbi:MAG: hypothetical protein NNA22_10245 [Nitrospira sp.]|nr:hypothetical protein [Nitrospira sp.]